MPCGPKTYGRQRGRPKKRRGKKSTDIMYEMIGESIWDTYKNMASLLSEKKKADWIQGAVDPAHKGFCTPMTKATCTPARKALAKRFKKAGRKKKKKGGSGWQGKV